MFSSIPLTWGGGRQVACVRPGQGKGSHSCISGSRGSQGTGVALEHPLCNLGTSLPRGLPGNYCRLAPCAIPCLHSRRKPGRLSPTAPVAALPVDRTQTQGNMARAPPLQSHGTVQEPSTQGTREGQGSVQAWAREGTVTRGNVFLPAAAGTAC